MKSEFKAKLLQHLLNKKNSEQGFTLIELLVVIIIIGILAAIALPSFLNQANKARQSEAKTYTGSMNRSQQAYFLEKNRFTSSVSLLGLGINTNTTNYRYAIATTTSMASSAATGADPSTSNSVNNYGVPLLTTLKGYVGTTWVGLSSNGGSEATTLAILCESTQTGTSTTVSGTTGASNSSTVTCATGMDSIK